MVWSDLGELGWVCLAFFVRKGFFFLASTPHTFTFINLANTTYKLANTSKAIYQTENNTNSATIQYLLIEL